MTDVTLLPISPYLYKLHMPFPQYHFFQLDLRNRELSHLSHLPVPDRVADDFDAGIEAVGTGSPLADAEPFQAVGKRPVL